MENEWMTVLYEQIPERIKSLAFESQAPSIWKDYVFSVTHISQGITQPNSNRPLVTAAALNNNGTVSRIAGQALVKSDNAGTNVIRGDVDVQSRRMRVRRHRHGHRRNDWR
jgi:hypothetical protein